ncbi:lef-4 [Erannis ankeraria nucleopolyhedrovirus]|uniref:lef-4 n=1 Tax=Erannis ankeraria nucleopolyhedrovirus TaxID=2913600 RepID=UPI00117B67DE|nr:lef-4 [Erannis ankeraria nucleopolyhedrovirus]UJZ89017.1 lef-4 [Erannis ankeraria nucleopolyhedrovirus]
MSSFIEKEISYSINLSQDLLYIILSSYISKKFTHTDEYVDCVDINNVRSRLMKNRFESTKKTIQSAENIVHIYKNNLVPLVNRISVEQGVSNNELSPQLKRIMTCQVFRPNVNTEIEIKFEKVYLDKNIGDTFDSLMASKQVALLNLLQNKQEKITKNSHLGSDEILAYLRIEYEYQSESPDKLVLDQMAKIINKIDRISHSHNISPMLPYTTIQNNIIYRKFVDERLIDSAGKEDVLKWAIKLDGVRGKGLFTRNFVIIFMDDMRMFSGNFPWLFKINNVVAFQCELVGESNLYITDLLHVFKYSYNNKTQYECSLKNYNIDSLSSIKCINYLNEKYNKKDLQLQSHNDTFVNIKFQHFMDPPIQMNGYNTVATDGLVVLDNSLQYVKYKYVKTIELEYNEKENAFYSLCEPLNNYVIVKENSIILRHEKIYETVIDEEKKTIKVLKVRNDRLVPQMKSSV